jgi:hypothetical protein
MTQQLALPVHPIRPAEPRTRRDDPGTSHRAASTVARTTALKAAILDALTVKPMTDGELVGWFRVHSMLPQASESGIRSRRAELVRDGLVIDTRMTRLTTSGRESTVWGRP